MRGRDPSSFVWRAARAAALAAAFAGAWAVTAEASARSDYERLLARIEAMRLDGPRPTPRPQMRRAATEAEALARRYAGSGYADNALWEAARVTLAAYRVYRRPADRTQGLEYLEDLVRRYPSSSLVPDARALLRRHAPAAQAKASARTPAVRPLPSPTPAPPSAAASVEPATVAAAAPAAVALPAAIPETATAPPLRSEAPSARPAASGRVATLRGLRRTQIGDTVRLTLDFDAEVAFEQQRLAGPDRVFFDFVRTSAIASLADTVLQFEGPAVRRVRLGRPKADVTRLVIDLDGVASYSVFALYHPFRLMIDLQPRRPATLVAGAASAPAAATTTAAVAATRLATPAPAPAPPVPSAPRLATSVSLPSALPPPAAPPALLRARRVAATVAPAVPPPTRVVVVEPLLAVDASPHAPGVSRRPIPAAPVVASRVVSQAPSLLRVRPRQPLMARAAVRPPAGLPPGLALGAPVAVETARAATRAERRTASAPVAPLPLIPAAPPENGAGGFSIARQLGLGASRIVIDPGHGGKDPGALGSKTSEAEVVLDVALRVEQILAKEAGIEVVLTRRTDVYIPLEERTALANRHNADLFLSIHANSSRNRKAAGVETYVLNFASNADAAAVAARENASAVGTMRNLPDIVKAITQNNKRDESRDFAGAVQESLVSRLKPHNAGLRDLGVKQAPFVVLIGAGMPSVLAEIAFISHEGEGGLLRTEKYRQRIAEALASAVLRYTRTLKPVGTVAAQD